jgi:hypothetical protein
MVTHGICFSFIRGHTVSVDTSFIENEKGNDTDFVYCSSETGKVFGDGESIIHCCPLAQCL